MQMQQFGIQMFNWYTSASNTSPWARKDEYRRDGKVHPLCGNAWVRKTGFCTLHSFSTLIILEVESVWHFPASLSTDIITLTTSSPDSLPKHQSKCSVKREDFLGNPLRLIRSLMARLTVWLLQKDVLVKAYQATFYVVLVYLQVSSLIPIVWWE